MKIDINYKFKTLEGKDISDQESALSLGNVLAIKTWEDFEEFRIGLKNARPFTLKKACVNVLLMTEIDGAGRPKELKGEEKVERYELAKSIHKSGPLVDLQSEQISLLKRLIARAYGPLTVGQAWKILDPHEEAEKEAKKKENDKKDN